jgi:6-phosphogluconolactonase
VSLAERFVAPDRAALAAEIASRFRRTAERALEARGRFAWALTGGSAAEAFYPHLALDDWAGVHCFWGDERAVPADDPASNHRLARTVLLDRVPIPPGQVHRMPAEASDLDAAARAYEATLRATLGQEAAIDLVHLGMGPDGHVASLFPGHALLDERTRLVAAVLDSPKPPARRLTLTLAALARARAVWITVTGAEKAAAVRAALEDPASALPAAILTRGPAPVRWLLDRAAAGG